MIKSEKKVRELKEILAKDNYILISEAIGLLREVEPFEGAIGQLALFYDNNEDHRLRKTIEEFMNDLKDQAVRKEIMAEIRKPFKPATIKMLISSCWQSGLNYSEYSTDLAEIFLAGDYVTAFECLTVIEESVHELSRAKRNDIVRLIREYPLPPGSDKTGLANELISILKNG